jgi:hypothetical protein
MKKFSVFISVAVLFFLSLGTYAQTKSSADYFTGKWSVLVKGTPQGDARMFVILEKKDTTMTGDIKDSSGNEMTKITKIELKVNEVTVYFTAQGYDVYLVMDKTDDDHAKGSMMGMFDADCDRVKSTQ